MLAPVMVVAAGDRDQLCGEEDVIEPPTAVMSRDRLPRPTWRRQLVSVQRSIRVAVSEVLEARDDAEFRRIPVGSAVGPQAAARVTRERTRSSVWQLASRGIQISAQHAWCSSRRLEPAP